MKKLVSVLMAVVMCLSLLPTALAAEQGPSDPLIDRSTFPDFAFRTYVERNVDSSEDGVLDIDEVNRVMSLDFSKVSYRSSIRDLTGMEQFHNLHRLDCSKTSVNEIIVSQNNAGLSYINCAGSPVQKLDLTNAVNLEQLNCNSTMLHTLDVSGLTTLRQLYCANNGLVALDLGNQPGLVPDNINFDYPLESAYFLSIAEDATEISVPIQLFDIDVTKMEMVENGTLDLANKKITGIDASKLVTYIYHCGTANGTRIDMKVHLILKTPEGELPIDRYHFPDDGFRAYVKESYDLDLTGTLSQHEIEEAWLVDIQGRKDIRDLTGIEFLSDLIVIDCDGSGVEELDLSRNLTLRSVALCDMPLRQLALGEQGGQFFLFVDNTELTGLDLRDVRRLSMFSANGSTPLGWLRLVDGLEPRFIDLKDRDPFVLDPMPETIDLCRRFPGIDPGQVKNVTNGTLNPGSGVITVTDQTQPVTYEYQCCDSVTLKVTFQKAADPEHTEGALDGTVTLTGAPYVDEKLRVQAETNAPANQLRYTWYRNNKPFIENSRDNVYLLQETDDRKNISCSVRWAGHDGELIADSVYVEKLPIAEEQGLYVYGRRLNLDLAPGQSSNEYDRGSPGSCVVSRPSKNEYHLKLRDGFDPWKKCVISRGSNGIDLADIAAILPRGSHLTLELGVGSPNRLRGAGAMVSRNQYHGLNIERSYGIYLSEGVDLTITTGEGYTKGILELRYPDVSDTIRPAYTGIYGSESKIEILDGIVSMDCPKAVSEVWGIRTDYLHMVGGTVDISLDSSDPSTLIPIRTQKLIAEGGTIKLWGGGEDWAIYSLNGYQSRIDAKSIKAGLRKGGSDALLVPPDMYLKGHNSDLYSYVEISPDLPTPQIAVYPLFLGGTQVTDENKGDILGNGTASYDSEAHRLTLHDAHIAGRDDTELWSANTGILVNISDNLEICLQGENTVSSAAHLKSSQNAFSAFTGPKSLKLSGDGVLRLSSVGTAGGGAAFFTGVYIKSLNIEGRATVYMECPDGAYSFWDVKSFNGTMYAGPDWEHLTQQHDSLGETDSKCAVMFVPQPSEIQIYDKGVPVTHDRLAGSNYRKTYTAQAFDQIHNPSEESVLWTWTELPQGVSVEAGSVILGSDVQSGSFTLTAYCQSMDVSADVVIEVEGKNADTSSAVLTQEDWVYGAQPPAPRISGVSAPIQKTEYIYTGTTRSGKPYGPTVQCPADAGSYQVSARVETANAMYEAGPADFTIQPRDIADAEILRPETEPVYRPNYTHTYQAGITLGGQDITGFCDVSGNQGDRANTYQITFTAKPDSNYCGSASFPWKVQHRDISDTSVQLSGPHYYTGQSQTVTITRITCDNFDVEDYSYTGNTAVEPGVHYLTLQGKGNYTGTRQIPFEIRRNTLGNQTLEIPVTAGRENLQDLSRWTQPETDRLEITAVMDDQGILAEKPELRLVENRWMLACTLRPDAALRKQAVITVQVPQTAYSEACSLRLILQVQKKQTLELTDFPQSSVNIQYSEAVSGQTVQSLNFPAEIKYTSSNPAAVQVDAKTGEVTVLDVTDTPVTITAAVSDTAAYDGASRSYTVTVNPAVITIVGKTYFIVVGDPVPVLGRDSYTVLGLAEGDSLKKEPAVAYDEQPDENNRGVYHILLSKAEVPDTRKYSPEIQYQKGMLAVERGLSIVTVSFDLQGHGKAIPEQSYDHNVNPNRPAAPIEEGWIFDDWYTGTDFRTLFDFSKTYGGNVTAYAHWLPVAEDRTSCTVRFDLQGRGAPINERFVTVGSTLSCPADPTDTELDFGGWYTDPACRNRFDFSKPVTGDVTLYAKWAKTEIILADDPATPGILEVTLEKAMPGKCVAAVYDNHGKMLFVTTTEVEEGQEQLALKLQGLTDSKNIVRVFLLDKNNIPQCAAAERP